MDLGSGGGRSARTLTGSIETPGFEERVYVEESPFDLVSVERAPFVSSVKPTPDRLERKANQMPIHQEAIIEAAPRDVYAVLTDGEKFAAATGMPAQIGEREGDRFALFGGRVEGRLIELAPGERVVQAWRFAGEHPEPWDAGVYSVVRFTLSPHEAGTEFVIDHDAIPPAAVERIEAGYPSFYREPLASYLSAA